MKVTVIKAQTVQEATKIYGENAVETVFNLIQNQSPKDVMEELDDENLKKCLLFLLNNDI